MFLFRMRDFVTFISQTAVYGTPAAHQVLCILSFPLYTEILQYHHNRDHDPTSLFTAILWRAAQREGREAARSSRPFHDIQDATRQKARLQCDLSCLRRAYLCSYFKGACKCVWFRSATSLTKTLLDTRSSCCENGVKGERNPKRDFVFFWVIS